jgi:hypothetical protein
MTGREFVPIYEQTPYEWPKNTGQVYLAVAKLVGAESSMIWVKQFTLFPDVTI